MKSNNVLHTKWGTAKAYEDYYQIISTEKGNQNKYLHVLIWEEAWGKKPKNWVVHHLDGNIRNNCLLNLYGMDKKLHISLHNKGRKLSPAHRKQISERTKGENNPFYGKHHTEESKRKISAFHKGKPHSEKMKQKISKTKNNSGYFRVCKTRIKNNQGFTWRYKYYENGIHKALESVSLKKLEEKVKAKGLKWEKFT